jgi:hypothetical protein
MNRFQQACIPAVLAFFAVAAVDLCSAAPPQPPVNVAADDQPWDAGDELLVTFDRSPDDIPGQPGSAVTMYVVQQKTEENGVYREATTIDAGASATPRISVTIEKTPNGDPFWFRVAAKNAAGERSAWAATPSSATASRQYFDVARAGFFGVLLLVCGAIVTFIAAARNGYQIKIRKMAGLDAIDEAVGRATEMGKSCLFIAGLQDLNEIETIAGITVLSRVAEKAAEYDATVLMPTSRSLVMTAARETTQAAYLAAGRPDAYQEDRIYYVTDEQFGFVAHVTGLMQREKPAACFYMGQFFAESLLLGETGNEINAIQIAGTAQPAQLPFFVAACDYTLIGEEFFAASAYLSGDPDQLGSLKGQDLGKLLVGLLLFLGCGALTVYQLTGQPWAQRWANVITDTILTTS